MSEKELTEAELEKAAGGKRKSQANQQLQDGDRESTKPEAVIQDVGDLGGPIGGMKP